MIRTSSIYDHFDLYLTPLILTFNLPKMFQGQQLCQVVFESMHYCTSYGPDKFGRTHRRTDARTHAHTPNQNCNNYVSLTRKRARQKQLNHDKPDLSQLYTKRVNHFIRRYSEFRGLCFRLSFFGTKILQNGKYLIQCYFQMHFYPPVSHEFQENTKLRTLLDGMHFYRMAEPATQYSPREFDN